MSSNFAQRSSHEDCANLIYYQKFGDIVWISPHNCKLLGSSISIEFSDAIGIANSHNVKDTIKSRANTLTIFIPNFKQFLSITIHDHITSISKLPLHQ
jgi:hypothetical protein